MAAKPTWYAKTLADTKYSTEQRIYAGTYTDNNRITVDIQLWNNRWGTEDVDDLIDYDIAFFFDRLEDSALLDYCSIYKDETKPVSYHVTGKKAVLEFETMPTLSGGKNSGSSIEDTDNYLQLRFVFSAVGERLKDNDLKSLYFEVLER